MASRATFRLPLVAFLKPTGQERPEASSRCTWLSVVRAPMAPQLIRSATYWGLMGSRYSVPAGRPMPFMSSSSWRARCSPLLMWKVPFRSGSLIKPFQPTVVRGFSKYTRITISRSSWYSSCNGLSLEAYSRAASGSCTEQGPITTSSRSSSPCRILWIAWRALYTVSAACSVMGKSVNNCSGDISSFISRIRRSSVL